MATFLPFCVSVQVQVQVQVRMQAARVGGEPEGVKGGCPKLCHPAGA